MIKPITTDKCQICGESHKDEIGHHCPDWDFLFVRPSDPEMEACLCSEIKRRSGE